MKIPKDNQDYFLMKTTDILAKLLDDDYQESSYNKISSRVEARFLLRDIEEYFLKRDE